MLEDRTAEEEICTLSHTFLVMAAHTAIEAITKATITVVGGWWVMKVDKKGDQCCNGNFNFMVVNNVLHSQIIMPFQHVFLEHLKIVNYQFSAQLPKHVCTD